jgi:hypothetical protein
VARRSTVIRQRRALLVALDATNRRLTCAMEDALATYLSGHRTAGCRLNAGWDVVAQRMAEALEGALYAPEVDEGARADEC